ncbi:MAG: hypothetical protein D6730_02365 [Bacteroidetes bacterium]|nr:MAG: hypothetical protein D6730_02365 [Bacteroidota bacterium]
MFQFFKNNHRQQPPGPSTPKMVDLYGAPLRVGDLVESMRYDLGVCKIVQGKQGLEYESVETGKRVLYVLMVDAATSFQKVKKIS